MMQTSFHIEEGTNVSVRTSFAGSESMEMAMVTATSAGVKLHRGLERGELCTLGQMGLEDCKIRHRASRTQVGWKCSTLTYP